MTPKKRQQKKIVSLLKKYQKLVKQLKKMQRTHHNKISKKYQKNNAMTVSHDSDDADFIYKCI
jgi:hypothetical protein